MAARQPNISQQRSCARCATPMPRGLHAVEHACIPSSLAHCPNRARSTPRQEKCRHVRTAFRPCLAKSRGITLFAHQEGHLCLPWLLLCRAGRRRRAALGTERIAMQQPRPTATSGLGSARGDRPDGGAAGGRVWAGMITRRPEGGGRDGSHRACNHRARVPFPQHSARVGGHARVEREGGRGVKDLGFQLRQVITEVVLAAAAYAVFAVVTRPARSADSALMWCLGVSSASCTEGAGAARGAGTL